MLFGEGDGFFGATGWFAESKDHGAVRIDNVLFSLGNRQILFR